MTDIIPNPGVYPSGRADYIVPLVINASWNYGLGRAADYDVKIAALTTNIDNLLANPAATHVSAGSVSPVSIAEPNVAIPTSIDTASIMSTFDTKYLELVQMLADKFTAFRTTYFPDESTAYNEVETWLKNAIANPAGLPAAVAAQVWGDDQARILSDKVRAQEAMVAQFAGRRFPLPPDVAASAVMQLEQKAQDAMAESSRRVAIMSVELQKFNVERLLQLRQMAMEEAVRYITALASGPDMASRVVNVGYDAQSKLISAASQFYNARSQATEVMSKVGQFNVSTALDAAVKNQTADLTLIGEKVKALTAQASALAQMATSLFNNIHAQAQVGANQNNAVNYSYSNDTSGAVSPKTSA